MREEVRGYKGIASILEQVWKFPVEQKSAFNWSRAKNDPLPVSITRNIARAYVDELVMWAKRNFKKLG